MAIMMNGAECIKKMPPVLFWDIDKSQADMDKYQSFCKPPIQRKVG